MSDNLRKDILDAGKSRKNNVSGDNLTACIRSFSDEFKSSNKRILCRRRLFYGDRCKSIKTSVPRFREPMQR